MTPEPTDTTGKIFFWHQSKIKLSTYLRTEISPSISHNRQYVHHQSISLTIHKAITEFKPLQSCHTVNVNTVWRMLLKH